MNSGSSLTWVKSVCKIDNLRLQADERSSRDCDNLFAFLLFSHIDMVSYRFLSKFVNNNDQIGQISPLKIYANTSLILHKSVT